ncbi:TetR/AcrR family transcriptional regulator [uncultured Megasphaera sp.]|uniref:TetR/AcrR family transcriptional regulator n=1 Tax=uncultured Megasphaera sp. TaxID=165188 RepID=UPI00261F253E|nr:TetR/AcrR family transcriptional regulator [uncultured Megasphaera sp.]
MTENIRAKILAEALREINRHGSDFHMDDLARNLRISKRTLYEHFSSKQEIVEQAIANFSDEIYAYHQRIVNNPDMTCEAKLIAYFDVPSDNWQVLSVRKVSELLSKMPGICERLQSRYKKDWYLLEQLLDEAQETGEFKPFDKFLFLRLLHSAADDIIDYFNDVNHDSSFSDYMKRCIKVLLYGIKNQESKEIGGK